MLTALDGIIDGTDNYDQIVISDNSSVDPDGNVVASSLVQIESFSDADFTVQVGSTEFSTTVRGLTVNSGDNGDVIQIVSDGIASDLTINIDGDDGLDRVQIIGPSVSGEATYSPDGSELGAGTFNIANSASIEFENVESVFASEFGTLNIVTPEGADEIIASRADNGLSLIHISEPTRPY